MHELAYSSVQSSLPGQTLKTASPSQKRKHAQPYRRVYFVRHLETGAIKIGKSANPKRRLLALQKIFGGRMELIGYIVGESGEYTLHKLLDHWAIGQEWFRPSHQVMNVVRTCLDKGLAHGVELAERYAYDH